MRSVIGDERPALVVADGEARADERRRPDRADQAQCGRGCVRERAGGRRSSRSRDERHRTERACQHPTATDPWDHFRSLPPAFGSGENERDHRTRNLRALEPGEAACCLGPQTAVGDKLVIAHPTNGPAGDEIVVRPSPPLYLPAHVLFRLRMASGPRSASVTRRSITTGAPGAVELGPATSGARRGRSGGSGKRRSWPSAPHPVGVTGTGGACADETIVGVSGQRLPNACRNACRNACSSIAPRHAVQTLGHQKPRLSDPNGAGRTRCRSHLRGLRRRLARARSTLRHRHRDTRRRYLRRATEKRRSRSKRSFAILHGVLAHPRITGSVLARRRLRRCRSPP